MSLSSDLKTYLRMGLEKTLGKKPSNFFEVPIIINNYNRLEPMTKLIDGLEKRGYQNIHILDNQSTYAPLLEFYNSCNHQVQLLKKNYGSKAFWKSGLWSQFRNQYFVYTDSDVAFVDECPANFLQYFFELLVKYPKVHKVGFSLKIDDLPDHFQLKDEVIQWEQKFYENTLEPNLYIAPIDTTFALYRPFSRRGKRDGSDLMLRTGPPYQMRHMPWYSDSQNLSEEESYYLESVNIGTHWSRQQKK